MKEFEKLSAIAVVCIIIGMGIGYALVLPNVQRLQQYADQLKTDLTKTSQQVVDLQAEIEEKDDLIEKIENDYQHLSLEHDKLISMHDSLQTEYAELSKEYKTLEEAYEVVYDSRYKEGYDAGYTKGFEETGYNIRDPTYSEAMEFVRSDKTDKNRFIEGKYVCFHFVADFKSNAFEAGYRCGFVYILFPESAHGIVCFNTTDKGLIFIEPQNDDLMKLTEGKPYWPRSKYQAPPYDDTVLWFAIIW